MSCYYCKQPNGKGPRELRPYGPGGADVCAGCTMGDKKRNAAAQKQYGKQLDAAGDVAVMSDLSVPRLADRAARRESMSDARPR